MSIKKIAEMAGTSPATVSRVLNNPNYKCSSSELRDKIWKAAIELNYVPNEAARNLKLGMVAKKDKTYYINVLMTRADASRTDSFFSELLRIIESEIHKQMCILTKVWYMPLFSDDRRCHSEDLEHIISEMYSETKDKCDGKKVAEMAVEYLIQLGHRNIGYVGECSNEARYKGFLSVLNKYDIDVRPGYVIETKQTEAEGYEAMKTFLAAKDCPTGIYCANDITAIGMLKYLSKHKNRYYMPSIISSDDIEEAQNVKPMLTTVRFPKEEMGKFALFLLMNRIKGGHKSIAKIELEGKLMIRNSCTPVEETGWCDYFI